VQDLAAVMEQQEGDPQAEQGDLARQGRPTSNADSILVYAAGGADEDELLSRNEIFGRFAEVCYHEGAGQQEASGSSNARRFARGGAASFPSDELDTSLPRVKLPYKTVEVIFNHTNLWVSKGVLDPAQLRYNFKDSACWAPFLSPRMRAEGHPEAFYLPRRLASKLPDDRLRAVEHQIMGEIKSHVSLVRGHKHTSMNAHRGMVLQLERALELHEAMSCGDETARESLERWRQAVKDRAPIRSQFHGKAINYAYTDAKRVRKHMLSCFDDHVLQGNSVEFVVVVRCFGYYCAVCSVWVYFGALDNAERAQADAPQTTKASKKMSAHEIHNAERFTAI